MNLLADTDPSLNAARFNNDEYKKLIAQGLQTPNGSARDDIYLQCEKIIASEQPWLPISHAKALIGYKQGVDGFVFHPTGNTYLRNCTKSA